MIFSGFGRAPSTYVDKRHPYIFPSSPSFLPCVTHPPAAANGPRGLIFWHVDGTYVWLDSFWSIGVKGQKSMKICHFRADFGHTGYVWDYLGPGRVRWGTIGSMPSNIEFPKCSATSNELHIKINN